MCFLCDQYKGVPVSLTTHISVFLLPEYGNVRSHRHGGRKSVLWLNYNDVIKTVHAYQKEHGVDGRIDPRAQRTEGTLGERIAAGDPEARAMVSAEVVQALLEGTPEEVATKVRHFDATWTPPTRVIDLTGPKPNRRVGDRRKSPDRFG